MIVSALRTVTEVCISSLHYIKLLQHPFQKALALLRFVAVVAELIEICWGFCAIWFGKMCYEGAAGSSKHRRVQLQRSGSSMSRVGSTVWQESQLKEAFDLMDRDGDGTIKAEDLSHFLQCSVVRSESDELSEEEVATMIAVADRDGNGGVEFEEFLSLVQGQVLGESTRSGSLSSLGNDAFAEIFRVLDRNGDGVLCSDDLSGVMGELGQVLSSEDLLAMLETATGSDRQHVSFEEFCLLMSSAATDAQ